MKEKLIKSKRRVRDFGEVLTGRDIVDKMLDTLPQGYLTYGKEGFEKKVFEPTCGTGNFLVAILEKRLKAIKNSQQHIYYKTINAYISLGSLYGIDIQYDNVLECRARLKTLLLEYLNEMGLKVVRSLIDILLCTNIQCGDTLKMDWFEVFDLQFIFKGSLVAYPVKTDEFLLTKWRMNLKNGESEYVKTVPQTHIAFPRNTYK